MQTVGDMLRSEREKKGLTLKDVENSTNIRVLYLNAIETGNYSAIPGEVYLKGFIRNYANSLGLNGAEYVELYRQSQQPEEPEPVKENKPAPPRPRRRSRTPLSMWIALVIVVVLIGSGVVWLLMGTQKESSKAIPQSTPVQENPAPANMNPAPTTDRILQSNRPVPAKPVTIVANFTERSWIQVTVDDKQVYEGIPQSGQTFTWQADRKISLKAGNAAAVQIIHNGQPIGKLGGNGEVIVKTFTAGTEKQ